MANAIATVAISLHLQKQQGLSLHRCLITRGAVGEMTFPHSFSNCYERESNHQYLFMYSTIDS